MASSVQTYERAEFPLVEVYATVGKYVISVCPKIHYMAEKKARKRCNLIIF